MKRGGYGKPWRKPAGGWSVPRKAFLGGLYQHRRAALNGLTKYVNDTQGPLQQNQVGRPTSRPNFLPSSIYFCAASIPDNGLPKKPWIGVGDDQYLLSQLPNHYTIQGTNDRGLAARLRGGKWVQAQRSFHGGPGFLAHDPGGCSDVVCAHTSGGVTTYSYYESSQVGAASQKKYCTLDVLVEVSQSATWHYNEVLNYPSGYTNPTQTIDKLNTWSGGASAHQQVSVNPLSGVKTLVSNSYSNTSHFKATENDSFSGLGTVVTEDVDTPHDCAGFGDPSVNLLNQWVNDCGKRFAFFAWNASRGGANVFSGNATEIAAQVAAMSVAFDGSWTATLTTFTVTDTQIVFQVDITPNAPIVTSGTGPFPGSPVVSFTATETMSGSARGKFTITLSDENDASDIVSDTDHLISFWPLNDDALYPYRTDGFWQIAPLVTRDEMATGIAPATVTPTVDDYRSPIQGSGTPDDPYVAWAQMAWFDPNAYGFRFPYGTDRLTAAATSLDQFALTGKILGMPMPTAFTSSESALYQAGYTPATKYDYQNFFDYRAEIWKACQYTDSLGAHQTEWYISGFGDWLYDAIVRTGAQLPHCCTQWTNNKDAANKLPYAYRKQQDQLEVQKCCEVLELWPSYNFARPAREDRFSRDETKVNCITGDDGTTLTVSATPLCITGDTLIVAGSSGGDGIFQCAGASSSFNTITRGTFVRPLPPGYTLPASPGEVAVLRWPSCPAILGRAFVAAVAAHADATGKNPGDVGYVPTSLVTVNSTDGTWLATGDAVDFYTTAITYDGSGNRVSEAMTIIGAGTNLAITWIDSQHFTVIAAASAINAAQYLQTHGLAANNWEWDDSGRKGDFVVLGWLADNRTNSENARLTGATDCSGAAITPPTANHGFADFQQAQYENATGEKFKPCCAQVVCISPNGESFPNGTTIAFPTTFYFDTRYGALWQGEIEQAMVDLLWQAPNRPCDFPYLWKMDDSAKLGDPACKDDDDTLATPIHYFAHYPLVEARITVPNYGGNSEADTAPTPPTGIGYKSPVTYSDGLQPPVANGFDPLTGSPNPYWTIWGWRLAMENTCSLGCRFDYVGMENLPCVTSYSPPDPAAPPDGNTGDGMTDTGLT